jgi:rhomboid protease GluP
LIPAARFTTVVILLINAGLYAATALFSLKASDGGNPLDVDIGTLRAFGAKWGEAIAAGQWWRLITAGFLHGGVLHILMNSWVIFDLGTTVEEFYGTTRYLVLYFVSTVAGFYASLWWSPYTTSVGASAALFGLIGAMIAFGLQSRSSVGSALRAHYTQWAIYGLIMGLIPGFRVDNAAHIGGLAAGFAVAYLVGTPPLVESWTEKLWRFAAACCVVITLAAFALMLRFLLQVQAAGG